jgi:NAD(P) transhydrogenase
MVTAQFDVIVIGSGPGGEGAAMQAAKSGKKVALVEAYREVGGGCTHWGTIPSKALRQSVQRILEVRINPLFAHVAEKADLSFPKLLKSAESVIRKQVSMRATFYERNMVQLLVGRARFIDAITIEIRDNNGNAERYSAESFVVATGSKPYRPKDIDFNHPRIFDSDTILTMGFMPQSITIYGAGVIGCEYASIFRSLGLKVNLIHSRDKLLAFLDDEIIDALSYHLREQGVLLRHNETMAHVIGERDGVILELESGKRIKTDVLLWANGRMGNALDMGLEPLGIMVNERGHIQVNDHYQTAVPTIYAVGDVIGSPSLASAAYDQGRYAATHLKFGKCDAALARDVPTGIYTTPEISSLGRTERELTAAKIPYEVGHSMFRSLARAQLTGHTVGMLKILFHRETLEILGIHCFGDQASEIIHIGQAIMTQPKPGNTLKYFINTTFNYPTMAEAYRVAALNGMNRLF